MVLRESHPGELPGPKALEPTAVVTSKAHSAHHGPQPSERSEFCSESRVIAVSEAVDVVGRCGHGLLR